MKLISPWRYKSTFLERWRATSEKPIFSNKGSSTFGVGEANSTNSNPIKPMGLSNTSAMTGLLQKMNDETMNSASLGRRRTGYAPHAAREVVTDEEVRALGHGVGVGS